MTDINAKLVDVSLSLTDRELNDIRDAVHSMPSEATTQDLMFILDSVLNKYHISIATKMEILVSLAVNTALQDNRDIAVMNACVEAGGVFASRIADTMIEARSAGYFFGTETDDESAMTMKH